MPQRSTPRLCARSLSASALERARSSTLTTFSSSTSASRSAYSPRSATGSRRNSAAWCSGLRSRRRTRIGSSPLVPLRTATARGRAVALDGLVVGARAAAPRAARSRSWGRARRSAGWSASAAAPAARRASRSFPSRTARTGTCGGRSRRRRARTARRARPPAPRPRAEPARTAALQPGRHLRRGRGRTLASWNRRPSPSSTAPSPRATRIRKCPVGRARPPRAAPSQREHLAHADLAVRVDGHVAAGLELEAVQRGLVLEPAAVDRGRQRKDRRLESLAPVAVLLEDGLVVAHAADSAWASGRRRPVAPRPPGGRCRGRGRPRCGR